MAETTPASYSSDPTLYLYTSLTAGSSHIVTATSRLETILKANRIPFRALDVATDEKARMLWGRRSKGKKLPGLVRYGMIVGDLEEVEEWNEYGELKQQVGGTAPAPSKTPSTSTTNTPSKPPETTESSSALTFETSVSPPSPHDTTRKHIDFKDNTATKEAPPTEPTAAKQEPSSVTLALRRAGAEAAKKAGEMKAEKTAALKASLSKPKTEDHSSASQPAPPPIEPTPAQVRAAPSPKPDIVIDSSEANETEKTKLESEVSPVTSPPQSRTVSTSLRGDPPPLNYSPKATPAVSSTSSIEVSDKPEDAEHHREISVMTDAPKEVVEEVQSQQSLAEEEEKREKAESQQDIAEDKQEEKEKPVAEGEQPERGGE